MYANALLWSLTGLIFFLTIPRIEAAAPSSIRDEQKRKSIPPVAIVQARLVAKQKTYTLHLNGKTEKEFRQLLKDGQETAKYPNPPKVNLILELTNHGDKDVQIQVGGTCNEITIDLQGPGAETVKYEIRLMSILFVVSKTITLAPGKSESVPIKHLGFGRVNSIHGAYWTAPGEYTLSASYETAISSDPAGAVDNVKSLGWVKLKTEPINLTVQAGR